MTEGEALRKLTQTGATVTITYDDPGALKVEWVLNEAGERMVLSRIAHAPALLGVELEMMIRDLGYAGIDLDYIDPGPNPAFLTFEPRRPPE